MGEFNWDNVLRKLFRLIRNKKLDLEDRYDKMIAFEFYFNFFISYRENVIRASGKNEFVKEEQRITEKCEVGESEFRESIVTELNELMDGGDIFEYYSKK